MSSCKPGTPARDIVLHIVCSYTGCKGPSSQAVWTTKSVMPLLVVCCTLSAVEFNHADERLLDVLDRYIPCHAHAFLRPQIKETSRKYTRSMLLH